MINPMMGKWWCESCDAYLVDGEAFEVDAKVLCKPCVEQYVHLLENHEDPKGDAA